MNQNCPCVKLSWHKPCWHFSQWTRDRDIVNCQFQVVPQFSSVNSGIPGNLCLRRENPCRLHKLTCDGVGVSGENGTNNRLSISTLNAKDTRSFSILCTLKRYRLCVDTRYKNTKRRRIASAIKNST